RIQEALRANEQALRLDPALPKAWYNKGLLLELNLNQPDAALKCYERALQLQPGFQEARTRHQQLARPLTIIAQSPATSAYPFSLSISAPSPPSSGTSSTRATGHEVADAQIWLQKGNQQFMAGDFQGAIACYDQALKIKPDKHEAFHNKGSALYALGRHEEAIACYDQALKIKPDSHEAWIGRAVAAVNSPGVKTLVCWFLPVEMQNPALDQRGYPGQLACLTEGLKYVQREANPEGWGLLHWETGRAHYFHGRFRPDARRYFQQALQEYRMALEVLTPERFPERHLEVIQDGIRALLGLGETAAAQQWRMQGLTVLQDLYRTASSSQKRQYEGKFASFRQLTVDLLVQEGEYATALREAELDKNRCLDWMLTAWTAAWEEPSWSPTVADMQQLLDASTAVVYWHLSPDALTTFVLRADAPEPQVLQNDSAEQPDSSARRQLRDFEDWVIDWNRDYDDYRAKGKDADSSERAQHPWRTQLAQRLTRLKAILRIADIEAHLEGVSRLILVPHRDLHRFPLHGLFNDRFTVTYLPSVQVGLSLPAPQDAAAPITSGDALLSIAAPASEGLEELRFAIIESSAIRSAFPSATYLPEKDATLAAVIQALQTPHRLIHFTGHGEYNQCQPHRSALALAGGDRLTAEAIQALSLEHCDLVSLSSCETAVTGSQTIETEYVGLVSAFLRARAAHVVSTLWVVDEVSNAYLMMHFYHQLLTQPGISLAIALQKTQQWLRQVTYPELAQWLHQLSNTWNTPVLRRLAMAIETDPVKISTTQPPYADLYYWAAFTLSGKF
ncbi:CHAT domain-containing protein, partial [Thermoleptolyngbya sp.]